MTATARTLPDGRLHLHHGPMDLIVEAWGEAEAVAGAYRKAWARFQPLLDELAAELPALRSPDPGPLKGPVARAMAAATAPFRPTFITPMAAVAGAVADEILGCLVTEGITKAYVNNGGDIALFLTPGESLTAAIAARAGIPDRITIRHEDPVRGIATSGWRGRSFSRGIADAATILAPTAAMADAAATIIGNEVDLPGHPAITRRPACDIKADSDLGTIPVTAHVAPLAKADRAAALEAGFAAARAARARGLIHAAALFLQGDVLTDGPCALPGGSPPKAAKPLPRRSRPLPDFTLRKLSILIEEIHHDGGPAPGQPRQRAAILALCANPFAGRYDPDLQPAMEALKPLGLLMTDRLIAALGGRSGIDAYGKGAIVGANGEAEHGALWHVPGGYAMRERLGESRAIVPSAMKVGAMGATLDVPLGHINAAYVRSHFDAMTVSMPDGPRADEVLFVLAMARGGRIHSRMGGLEVHQVKGEDGLR